MRIVSDNIKNALKQPTTQRKGRILVNGNYYEVYNVEYYADAYEDGNVIGNAIASQLDFDLPYIDKFNTFKYFDGVWTGNEYEYVDMGTFTVFDEQDEDEFNKHITAFDNLINFNKPFEEKGTYPKTLYEELQNVCQQANVELVNTSIPNGNFEVENNQFVNGETLKTVLKAICQISGNYGIIKEDKLVLQLTNDTDETILKNQHEPVVWKRKTYGINQVILQLGDVEGEYVIRQDEADIAENGVHKLVITNNPFAYTQDKRDTLIDALFNQVRGFGYIPYEMNCEWLNYLEIGDKITIDGIETTIFRIQGKSPKGLESFISAPGIIDSAVEYANNTNSIKNQITRTEIIVDKQNREITSVINTTEQLQKEINPTKDESGSEIIIEDASDNPLTYLEIEGKSTQETRSGKNLYNATVKQQGGSTNRLNASGLSVLPNTTYTLSTTPSGFEVNNYYKDVDGNNIAESRWVGLPYTFTTPENCYSIGQTIRRSDNSDITPSDFINVQLELGSTATDYEPYGASPSPDYPSEIKSVGYTNLFNKDNANILNAYLSSEKVVSSTSARVIYIPCNPNTTYKVQKVIGNAFSVAYTENTPNIGTAIIGRINTKSSPTLTITTGANAKYLVSQIMDNGDTLTEEEILNSIQIEEGSVAHSYIPYGKYGIEVKTVGKNLFNLDEYPLYTGVAYNGKGNEYWSGYCGITKHFPVVENTTYSFSNSLNKPIYYGLEFYDKDKKLLSFIVNAGKTFTTPINCKYIRFATQSNELPTWVQIEKGSIITEYEPYKEKTTVLALNEPLRSLPNGVKDIAYIKNNKLYVDRYVGSVVLNGSETFNTLSNPNRLAITKAYDVVNDKQQYSSHYIWNAWGNADYSIDVRTNGIRINNKDNLTIDEYKTWLSTHNTQVDYELATPVTEEYGEIEMLKTLKGYNNISTTDDLLPIINLTYVRDTVIADYVENHVTELKLTENEIKASVESVSSSVDGLNTTINRVQEITNDNSQVINVISTNIDKTSGEVREVTTTTGFTFNKDGMTIDDGSGFKAEHRSNGTYYKDGSSITGQYTKDGSKQKDLELFGVYSYGKENIDDTPMFICQLYADENGEECFGHFYNGEG